MEGEGGGAGGGHKAVGVEDFVVTKRKARCPSTQRRALPLAHQAMEGAAHRRPLRPQRLIALENGLILRLLQRQLNCDFKESSVVPQDEKLIYPRRERFEWRPSPVLCKHFDIVDPFMGKISSISYIGF
ncbi:unnamed protein product [Urochloa humidicola]